MFIVDGNISQEPIPSQTEIKDSRVLSLYWCGACLQSLSWVFDEILIIRVLRLMGLLWSSVFFCVLTFSTSCQFFFWLMFLLFLLKRTRSSAKLSNTLFSSMVTAQALGTNLLVIPRILLTKSILIDRLYPYPCFQVFIRYRSYLQNFKILFYIFNIVFCTEIIFAYGPNY